MRVASRKSVSASASRRAQRDFDRQRAQPMRSVYPAADRVRIDLIFKDQIQPVPSPQSHTLYPAARAFFRFACPRTDCDGEFDLSAPVATVLNPTARGQGAASGHLSCEGMRWRDSVHRQVCGVELDYKIEGGA
jgi:hypothetical protein